MSAAGSAHNPRLTQQVGDIIQHAGPLQCPAMVPVLSRILCEMAMNPMIAPMPWSVCRAEWPLLPCSHTGGAGQGKSADAVATGAEALLM